MADTKLLEKVLSLQGKFQSLQDQLASPEVMSDMKKYVQLNKDYKELEPVVQAGDRYRKLVSDLGIDSLSMLLLSLAAEHKFNMQFENTNHPFETVGEVCDYIATAVK